MGHLDAVRPELWKEILYRANTLDVHDTPHDNTSTVYDHCIIHNHPCYTVAYYEILSSHIAEPLISTNSATHRACISGSTEQL